MITLTAPGPLSPAQSKAARFGWFYVDVVDDAGNGAVVVVARALPFLVTAPDRPAVSIAVYGAGRQIFYVLQELADGDFAHDVLDDGREVVRAGGVVLTLRRHDGQLDVDVAIDVAVENVSAANATLSLRGVARVAADDDAVADDVHAWSVQSGPSQGVLRGTFDGQPLVVEGRGYCDRNVGGRALDDLGIARWWWCRVSGDDGADRVVYALWPKDGGPPRVLGLTTTPDGQSHVRRDLRLVPRALATTRFGHAVYGAVDVVGDDDVFVSVRDVRVVESGPFYVRGLVRGGVCEHVWPQRLDVGALAPFVAMRIAGADRRRHSAWLPLFCGLAKTRLSRIVRFWRMRWTRS